MSDKMSFLEYLHEHGAKLSPEQEKLAEAFVKNEGRMVFIPGRQCAKRKDIMKAVRDYGEGVINVKAEDC